MIELEQSTLDYLKTSYRFVKQIQSVEGKKSEEWVLKIDYQCRANLDKEENTMVILILRVLGGD